MIDGMKIFELEGVEVRAIDPRRPKRIAYGTVYDTTAMAPYKPLSLYNYVLFLPMVTRMNENIMMPPAGSLRYISVKLTIDNRLCETNDLKNYTVDDIEFINYIRLSDFRSPQDRIKGFYAHNYPCCLEIILKEGTSSVKPDFYSLSSHWLYRKRRILPSGLRYSGKSQQRKIGQPYHSLLESVFENRSKR